MNRLGFNIGRDAFFDVLRQAGLLIKPSKKYAKTTQSFGWHHQFIDHFNGVLFLKPNQAWVSDITYIRVGNYFMYLSLITDAVSRKIVGWKLANSLETVWVSEALEMALKQAKCTENIVHHSDRGFQYTSKAYTKTLTDNKMLISMGEKGNCYDNAMAERVNGILKIEYLLDTTFNSQKVALKAIQEAIDNYNDKRPHWSLKLKTPNQVHNAA